MSDDGLMTEAEAAKWVADYERDRCGCGGSPAWVEGGMHAVEWHNEHGWSLPAPTPDDAEGKG